MRFAPLCLLAFVALTACSTNEIPPLQRAVITSSTTTTLQPASVNVTVALSEVVALGEAVTAEPISGNRFPDGFSIEDRSCYQHDTGETLTTAVLYISADDDSLVGGIEYGDRAGFGYTAAAGTRRGTSFSVNVIDIPDSTVDNEDWFFEPFGVQLPEQVILDVIDCDVVVEAALAIETEVTRFPERP